jgi:hypothetical protein
MKRPRIAELFIKQCNTNSVFDEDGERVLNIFTLDEMKRIESAWGDRVPEGFFPVGWLASSDTILVNAAGQMRTLLGIEGHESQHSSLSFREFTTRYFSMDLTVLDDLYG